MADYTELEWSIGVQAPAEIDEIYEFRIYDGNTPLDAYSETPSITVSDSDFSEGSVTGAISWTGTVTGVRTPKGSITGAISLVGTVSGEAPITGQVIYPDSDVTRVGWVNEAAGTTNLWDSINETPASDADYITVSV